MRGGSASIEQAGLGKQESSCTDGNDTTCLGSCATNPLHDACVFLFGQALSRDHDRVTLKFGIEIRETMVRQEVQSRLPMHHAMGLSGGNRHFVGLLARIRRLQAVGMHQDVRDPRRFEQHAPLGDDDQERMHVLNHRQSRASATAFWGRRRNRVIVVKYPKQT
jgi:hypothetical protein